MECNMMIKGCTILTMDRGRIIKRGLIAINNERIEYVGREEEAGDIKAERIIDGHGKVAMPGLINCHTHIAMTLFRGIAEDQEVNRWLRETIWPLEAKLDPLDVYFGSLLGCLEMIKSGTTCFCDMYLYGESVVRAAERSGLRAVIAPGIIEAGDRRIGEKMLAESVRISEKYRCYAGGRITTRLGPHAVYTCSLDLLKKVRDNASSLKVGVHIHLAESKEAAIKVREERGISEVSILDEAGLLDSNLLAAHCIHLSREEIGILAERDVKVVYNPVSNMKLASGIPRIKEMLDLGVTVGLGTDGPASNNALDMFETMKTAALLQKIYYKDPKVLPARKVLEMATIDGAKALGLEDITGSIEAGKKADIILVDMRKPHLTPVHNVYASLVYSARGCDVDTTIVNGEILMENREVKRLREDEVIEKAEKTALNLILR